MTIYMILQSKIKLPFEIRTNVMYGKTIVMWIDDAEESQLWRFDGYKILSENLEKHLSQMKSKINYQNIIIKNEEISKIVGMFYGRIDWFVFEKNGELQYIVNEVQPCGQIPIKIPYDVQAYWNWTDFPQNKRWVLNIEEFHELFQNEDIGRHKEAEWCHWYTDMEGKKVKDETIQNFKNNKKIQEKIWMKFPTIKQDASDEKLNEFLSDFLFCAISFSKDLTRLEKYLFETDDN